ncbi:MAG: hypothetical protein LBB86_01065 [Oscillospiraceae bacterium]|jgi:hypothetical protein|nr:hypothetical protein [Oscillospiraceae bacterium]
MERADSEDFGETQAVYLSDREGDIYDYFERASTKGRMVICRRVHNRKVAADNGAETIQEFLNNQEVAGRYSVNVPKDYHTGREMRVAEMEVRFGTARILCSQGKSKTSTPMLKLQLVSAREINAPEGVKLLNWQLVTNLAVPDYEAARTCLAWYSRRWLIEMFHYTLKSAARLRSCRRIRRIA